MCCDGVGWGGGVDASNAGGSRPNLGGASLDGHASTVVCALFSSGCRFSVVLLLTFVLFWELWWWLFLVSRTAPVLSCRWLFLSHDLARLLFVLCYVACS